MSTQFQLASFLSSIAFMVVVGAGFIVILTLPILSKNPVYPIVILVVAGFIVSPLIGWIVASKILRLQVKSAVNKI